ncbi:hypothetical protein [Glycomyces dulcitolivorans]|uniref:hypothetical protein n=1 Tax=Glycomyces dulcitolivorans TaxID=2200759 RepID=UPI000DD2ECA8|nr:hypothetical protein [Glycomyces dulcitolivorans]
MEPLTAIVLGAMLVSGSGYLVYYVRRKSSEQRRAQAYAHWAAQCGFQYRAEDPAVGAPSAFDPFVVPLGSFNEWKGCHVFSGGHRGHRFLAYECTRPQDTELREPELYQVVMVQLPALRPLLDIGPEARDSGDMDFESQAFNNAFRVLSPSPRFAHDVIDPRMMEWMLASPFARGTRLRFEGAWLMTFRSGPLAAGEILPYVGHLADVLDRVPRHVWSEK